MKSERYIIILPLSIMASLALIAYGLGINVGLLELLELVDLTKKSIITATVAIVAFTATLAYIIRIRLRKPYETICVKLYMVKQADIGVVVEETYKLSELVRNLSLQNPEVKITYQVSSSSPGLLCITYPSTKRRLIRNFIEYVRSKTLHIVIVDEHIGLQENSKIRETSKFIRNSTEVCSVYTDNDVNGLVQELVERECVNNSCIIIDWKGYVDLNKPLCRDFLAEIGSSSRTLSNKCYYIDLTITLSISKRNKLLIELAKIIAENYAETRPVILVVEGEEISAEGWKALRKVSSRILVITTNPQLATRFKRCNIVFNPRKHHSFKTDRSTGPAVAQR